MSAIDFPKDSSNGTKDRNPIQFLLSSVYFNIGSYMKRVLLFLKSGIFQLYGN